MNPRALTVVMYHYVRSPDSRFPNFKSRSPEEFLCQLKYFKQKFNVISPALCKQAYCDEVQLPERSLLLTFDDGYREHFTTVFPLLKAESLAAVFFPVTATLSHDHVLISNKLQYVLASRETSEPILKRTLQLLQKYREEFEIPSAEDLYRKIGKASGYDDADRTFIKRLLQRDLPDPVRNQIADRLFFEFVTEDETTLARELYLSLENLRQMRAAGMEIGVHSHTHPWMQALSGKVQQEEISRAQELLKREQLIDDKWMFAYPYGVPAQETPAILETLGCSVAFTTAPEPAHVHADQRFHISRLDTNHFIDAFDR